jgi:hypothetical protein
VCYICAHFILLVFIILITFGENKKYDTAYYTILSNFQLLPAPKRKYFVQHHAVMHVESNSFFQYGNKTSHRFKRTGKVASRTLIFVFLDSSPVGKYCKLEAWKYLWNLMCQWFHFFMTVT